MSLEDETAELSLVYHGTREYIEELERGMADCNTKIAALAEIIDGLRTQDAASQKVSGIEATGATRGTAGRHQRHLVRKLGRNQLLTINPETPKTICQFCGQWHYCEDARKLRELPGGEQVYAVLSLCSFCRASVTFIPACVLLPERRIR